jgi:hypothetical protein
MQDANAIFVIGDSLHADRNDSGSGREATQPPAGVFAGRPNHRTPP